ncbi:unnamed protein product [Closterium sp. Naga37s-1]|nr:unnamed protein product [Closterium sp. Naga37s-1]
MLARVPPHFAFAVGYAAGAGRAGHGARAASSHEGIRAARAGRAGQRAVRADMKAFELLGLGAQDTVQYARVGEVGGDGAGDNDHDLDPLDHDSHNHVASSPFPLFFALSLPNPHSHPPSFPLRAASRHEGIRAAGTERARVSAWRAGEPAARRVRARESSSAEAAAAAGARGGV